MGLPAFIPSASNAAGTSLGTLISGVLYGYMEGAQWVPPIAAGIGMTPAGLTALAVLGVGMGVSYLVTHIAEVKNLNDLVSKWWPQIQKSYPTGKNGEFDASTPISDAGPNTNINKPVLDLIEPLPDNIAAHTVTATIRP